MVDRRTNTCDQSRSNAVRGYAEPIGMGGSLLLFRRVHSRALGQFRTFGDRAGTPAVAILRRTWCMQDRLLDGSAFCNRHVILCIQSVSNADTWLRQFSYWRSRIGTSAIAFVRQNARGRDCLLAGGVLRSCCSRHRIQLARGAAGCTNVCVFVHGVRLSSFSTSAIRRPFYCWRGVPSNNEHALKLRVPPDPTPAAPGVAATSSLSSAESRVAPL